MLEIDSRAFQCRCFFVLYVDGIGVGGDVGKNGTFNFAPAWLLLLALFETKLVLQQEFVFQNVLL
jgi:hypothetical protein